MTASTSAYEPVYDPGESFLPSSFHQDASDRVSTFVSTGSRRHPVAHSLRSNSISLGASALSTRTDSSRLHGHSQSVLVVDNPDAPAMDIRVVTRAQTVEPSMPALPHRTVSHMSDTTLQALDSPRNAAEFFPIPSNASLMHSSSSRFGVTPTSARSSDSQHERQAKSVARHDTTPDVDNGLMTIDESGSIPDVFMQRSLV